MDNVQATFLREFLQDGDHPCPTCSYNLHGLTGTRCPECGEELVLKIGTSDPRIAACIAGLVTLSAGAGLNGLLLIFAVIVTLALHRGGPPDAFIVINISGLAGEGVALAIWIRSWHRIRRLAPFKRWLFVAGCAALTLVNLTVFTLTV